MTSHRTSDSAAPPGQAPRQPLRLRLSAAPGRSTLDGGWWPQTRDLATELADLADHFPVHVGSVYRALYSRPDWTRRPRTVVTGRRRIKTGPFPRDDTHLVVLSMSTRSSITLLVVPPAHPAGGLCMEWAAAPLNRLTAAQILMASVGPDTEDHEPTDQWNDTGGNWWQGATAPSFRNQPTQSAGVVHTHSPRTR